MNQITQSVTRLAQQSMPTPLCAYLLDLDHLRHHATTMMAHLPSSCELFYATKANPDAQVLHTLEDIIDGFEVASGGELRHLQKTVPDSSVIFGGPGKLAQELQQALDQSVELIHVESLHELWQLQRLAKQSARRQDILLRMNIRLEGTESTHLAMAGKPTPFGIDEEQLPDIIQAVRQCENLSLKGFHFHLMSHQCDVDRHIHLMRLCFQRYKKWQQEYHLNVDHLNVGGGFGVDYQPAALHFDWVSFCQNLDELINSEKMQDHTIRFESGRYITATCGYYAVEVLDIKKNFGDYFAICRGGTHHFRTPAAQNHSHPFTVIPGLHRQLESQVEQVEVTIVGQLCTPKDVLARNKPVTSLAIGDYVLFPLAGAYAWNISHQNFLMHEAPMFEYLPSASKLPRKSGLSAPVLESTLT